MPTYEYRCKKCGEHLEVVQSFSDDPLTDCPNCGGQLRKVFGSIGITFKGSGFYRTDSRSGTSTKTAASASEKGESSSGSDSDPKSSDSKSSDSKSSDSKSSDSKSSDAKSSGSKKSSEAKTA